MTGNQSGAKSKDFIKPKRRPWDERRGEEKVMKGDKMSLAALEAFMASRVSS